MPTEQPESAVQPPEVPAQQTAVPVAAVEPSAAETPAEEGGGEEEEDDRHNFALAKDGAKVCSMSQILTAAKGGPSMRPDKPKDPQMGSTMQGTPSPPSPLHPNTNSLRLAPHSFAPVHSRSTVHIGSKPANDVFDIKIIFLIVNLI